MTAYLHASHRLADADPDYGFDFDDLIFMSGARYRAHICFDARFSKHEIPSRPLDATPSIPTGGHSCSGAAMTSWRQR